MNKKNEKSNTEEQGQDRDSRSIKKYMNNFNLTNIKPQVTWHYLIGLIETDGSFHCTLTPNSANVKPMVKISQKTNTNVLALVQAFLTSYGINSTVDPGESKKGGRADALRIQGKHQVGRLLNLLEQNAPLDINGKKALFASAKLRDFLILKELCNNLTLVEKIDLLKSMRKTSKVEPDISSSGIKTRREHEEGFRLAPNASENAAASILDKIDATYTQTVANLEEGIANSTLVVAGNYLVGLIDGDGGYYVTYQFQEPVPRYNKLHIAWQGNLTLTMETNALLTLKVFMYAYGISTSIIDNKTWYQIKVRKQESMRAIMSHHDQYPLIGDSKQTELNLVKKLYNLKEQGLMRDYSTVEAYLKEVHQVSEISPKGPRRRPLEEVLKKVKIWLG